MWGRSGTGSTENLASRNPDFCATVQQDFNCRGGDDQEDQVTYYGNEMCHNQGAYAYDYGSSFGTDPLIPTSDARTLTVYAPCVSNINADDLLNRVYDGTDGIVDAQDHGKKKPGMPRRRPVPRQRQQPRRDPGGAGQVIYVTLDPFEKPKGPKIGQRSRTSTVVDRSGRGDGEGDYPSRYYAVSRTEELAANSEVRMGMGSAKPSPSAQFAAASMKKMEPMSVKPNMSKSANRVSGAAPPKSTSNTNLSSYELPSRSARGNVYDLPQVNSTMLSASKIQAAMEDLVKLPEHVERVVSKKMEDPLVKQKLLQMATKKLNIPTSTKLYRDLLDIETLPEVTVKRVISKEKKPVDPIPNLDDYLAPKYMRAMSRADIPLPKRDDHPSFVDLNSNLNERDLIRFDRIFVSQ